jgi:hypothetical protein
MNTAALVDALKSAFRVWVFTTLGLFIPGLLGWITEVTQWANQKGAPAFPDPSNLAYLFVAALTAAFPAAVAGIVRLAENWSGHTLAGPRAAGPETVPVAPRNDAGQSAVYLLVVVLLVLLVLYVVFRLVG